MSRILMLTGLLTDLGSLALTCLVQLGCLTTSALAGGFLFAIGLALRLSEPMGSAHDLPDVLETPGQRADGCPPLGVSAAEEAGRTAQAREPTSS